MESDNRKKVKGPVEVMPTLDNPEGMKDGEKKMPKVKKEKVKEACNHTKDGVDCPVHGNKGCPTVN